ncbi:MAG: class I SAM-dependent methyltransferase [Pseudomonadota bacterium]
MDWNAMAAPWLRVEAETDAAHAPLRDALMRRAALAPGQHVLDIGPGAGISLLDASRAVGPTGRVTGIEIAPPFAERARARVPGNVDVLIGDAAAYPFPPAGFDAAISLLGVMFFADPVQAFANIRTACKPGTALTFACWGPPDANPWFSMPARIAAGVLGKGAPFDPDAPGPMALADPAKIDRILSAAGWSAEIATEDMLLTPLGTPDEVSALQLTIGAATRRMRDAEEEGVLTDAHKEAIRSGLVDGFAGMLTDGAVRVPARIHIVHATA